MDLHQNARLTFRSRETLANKIMIEKVTLKAAAAAFNVSPKTAAKWVRRYRSLGVPGLRDRSSRPRRSPRRTSSELIAQVIGLRRQLRPAYHIAQATGLSPATVSRILQRAKLNRWRHLHPAPPVGKAERFIQTALREWAYVRHYLNSEERDQHLSPWLEHYNFHRPHGSLGYAPPISRAIPPGTTS